MVAPSACFLQFFISVCPMIPRLQTESGNEAIFRDVLVKNFFQEGRAKGATVGRMAGHTGGGHDTGSTSQKDIGAMG